MPSPPTTTTLPITLNANGNSVHNGIVQLPSTFYSSISSSTHSSATTNQKVFLASTDEEASHLKSEELFQIPSACTTTTPPTAVNTNDCTVQNSVIHIPSTSNGSTSSVTDDATTDEKPFLTSSDANADTVSTHECELESQLVLNVLPTMALAHLIPPVSGDSHTDDPEDQHTETVDVTSVHLSDNIQEGNETNCTSETTGVVDEEVTSSAATQQSQNGCHSVADEAVLSLTIPSDHESGTAEGTRTPYVISIVRMPRKLKRSVCRQCL